MKLFYFAPSDIQVARVDRQCIVNFCDALQEIGIEVELIASRIRLHEREAAGWHPLAQYRIHRPFPVRLVRVPVRQTSPGWWKSLNRLLVHTAVALRLLLGGAITERSVFYVKNYAPAGVLLALSRVLGRGRTSVVFEAHQPPKNAPQRWVLRACSKVVANTNALAEELVASNGIDIDRVIGTHQGVDLDLIDKERLTRVESRVRLALRVHDRLVVYTGKVYWKYEEVEHIVSAASQCRDDEHIQFLVVGGRADHVDRWRAETARLGLQNVVFTGFVPPNLVQHYQAAADVLILYYPSGIGINEYRSPGKLFEYMAAGRPIIAVDLPVLREVLGEPPAAYLVPQDSPPALAAAIRRVLGEPEVAAAISAQAYERVKAFTWKERARKIIEFLGQPI